MTFVKPKKHLGQHFLKNNEIAHQICNSLSYHANYCALLEIGPGTGVLTQFLFTRKNVHTKLIEVDIEAYEFLINKYPEQATQIIRGDFLHYPIHEIFSEPFGIIGNFPYNISSQILFKVFENRNSVPEVVGMFQKEVAERIASKPNSKKYGILSVLLQAFYTVEFLFVVDEHEFIPPPNVKSAVIRLRRNDVASLNCDEHRLVTMVKQAFNQRRKMLRNALHGICFEKKVEESGLLSKRAEQLTVADFEFLCAAEIR